MYEFITHRIFVAEYADEAIGKTRKICSVCEKQEGLVSIQVYRPYANPNELYLVEQWTNEAVFKKWIESEVFKDYLESVAKFDAGLNFLPSERLSLQ
nr:antibiotic biosynthesis monooxygenase family protein [Acinetobacter sp. Marseille-Q1620]